MCDTVAVMNAVCSNTVLVWMQAHWSSHYRSVCVGEKGWTMLWMEGAVRLAHKKMDKDCSLQTCTHLDFLLIHIVCAHHCLVVWLWVKDWDQLRVADQHIANSYNYTVTVYDMNALQADVQLSRMRCKLRESFIDVGVFFSDKTFFTVSRDTAWHTSRRRPSSTRPPPLSCSHRYCACHLPSGSYRKWVRKKLVDIPYKYIKHVQILYSAIQTTYPHVIRNQQSAKRDVRFVNEGYIGIKYIQILQLCTFM